jgi:hypothetical protein
LFPTIKDKKLLDSIYFTEKNIGDFSREGLQNYLQKSKNIYFNRLRKDSKIGFQISHSLRNGIRILE